MSLRPALLLPLLGSFALAACDRSEPEAVDTKPQPILQGSVSDAMIQTDAMQAEAPLEAPEATAVPGDGGATKGKSGRSGRAGSPNGREETTGGAGDALPEPEASPAANAAAAPATEAAAAKAAPAPGPRPTP